MTKINDYLWQLPHTPSFDDPPDVTELMQRFNTPIVAALEHPLSELGYALTSNDIVVRLDAPPVQLPVDTAEVVNIFVANVRFIKYLQEDIITRLHIEHANWSSYLPDKDLHRYYINLDRFKITDRQTQTVVPSWAGRLHSRMSNLPGEILHHDGEDQIWVFESAEQMEQQLQLLLDKFTRLGRLWLEDTASISG